MQTSPSDAPLAEDAALLIGGLQRVVRRLESSNVADAMVRLEQACRARRKGAEKTNLDSLFALVSDLSLEHTETIVRALTLSFVLLNTCEQVSRLLHRREAEHHSLGRVEDTLRALAKDGVSAQQVRETIDKLEVRPVLTAHPTQATRKTLLASQARIAERLVVRRSVAADERAAIDAALETELELLWLTAEVVRTRPSVRHEVSTALWYLEDRLFDASAELQEVVGRTFANVYGEPLGVRPRISLGTWVAGDRDGNPFVTPDETLSAARRAACSILRHYVREVDELKERLALSAMLREVPAALRESLQEDQLRLPETWGSKGRWYDDEPLRLKLAFMAERLHRTLHHFEARAEGHQLDVEGAYGNVTEFSSDLALVESVLADSGAVQCARTLVAPLRARVEASGFFGARLDVRQHSAVHEQAVDALAERAGVRGTEMLRDELLGGRPLVSPYVRLDNADVERTRAVFRTMSTIQCEVGNGGANTVVISMTRSGDDLLRVLVLGQDAGLVDLSAQPAVSRFDVVPLFETGADLEAAPDIMRVLFADPAYRRQLEARGHRQEVMIGYSDSGKDIGLLPAAWSLYKVQDRLGQVAREAGVELSIFHGLGGTVGRGGGSPVARALSALPPGTLGAGIKITEQGEVISQKYGLAPLAERSLEVMFSGAIGAALRDWRTKVQPEDVARYADAMEALAALNEPRYRAVVHEHERLFEMFLTATPVRELAHVHFGSRPVYRDNATKMSSLRAIPWTFGWTQMRLMVPVWLGLGAALDAFIRRPDGLATLQEMAARWPFFDDLLAKVEMVMAKADLEIARLYVERLGADADLFAELSEEFERARRCVLLIRGRSTLITDADLEEALLARAPLLDALALFQVHLLGWKRSLRADDPSRPRVEAALGTTLSGIAQGLRNTG